MGKLSELALLQRDPSFDSKAYIRAGGQDLRKPEWQRDESKVLVEAVDGIPAFARYMRRIDAVPKGMLSAVVLGEVNGYPKEVYRVTLKRNGEVVANKVIAPTEDELKAIAVDLLEYQIPETSAFDPDGNAEFIPPNAKHNGTFRRFLNSRGTIEFIEQVFVDSKTGRKVFLPWSYWSDRQWRMIEPDSLLPVWGMERIGRDCRVMIHEGAKAAEKVRELCDEFILKREISPEHRNPWIEELSHFIHLGWVGGANSPHRTDWLILKQLGVREAYIVSDNDDVGRSAVPVISKALNLPTWHLQFTKEWDEGFDLGDKFPDRMFTKYENREVYTGPNFELCVHPATWATNLIPQEKGKQVTKIRDCFLEVWKHVESVERIVCLKKPRLAFAFTAFNNHVRHFSDVNNVAELVVKEQVSRIEALCYRPGELKRQLTTAYGSSLNTYEPSLIKPIEGDPRPFLEFLSYLIDPDLDRAELERWIATLVGKPGLRLPYSLLLISGTQGTGKTTLTEQILRPLVGSHNSSSPGDSDIASDYNDWAVNKKLVCVQEVYQGNSWKTYNKLKSILSDDILTVNQKYVPAYEIENHLAMVACSNSFEALKIDATDRRILIPEVTERPWPSQKFVELREWLKGDGLGIIMFWAQSYSNFVKLGDRAPNTKLKTEIAESSRGADEVLLERLVRQVAGDTAKGDSKGTLKPIAFNQRRICDAIKSRMPADEKMYMPATALRKKAQKFGMFVFEDRVSVESLKDYIIMNGALKKALMEISVDAQTNFIKSHLSDPSDYLKEEM